MAETSQQDVHDAFIALEESAGLWDLQAYGQRYWHQIRQPVYMQVLQATGLMGRPQRSWRDRPLSSWLGTVQPSHWPHAARRANWANLDRADVLVINHPRHVERQGQWVCPYTQPLLEGLPDSHWVVEDVWQGVHSHPQSGARLKYLEWNFLFSQIGFLMRHGLTGGRLDGAEREAAATWRAQLQDALGGAPAQAKALAMTRAAVRELAAFEVLYGRLLDRVQPKLIVMVVHYSYRCLPLTALARQRGIEVAELQHGTMGSTHLAYNVAPQRRPPSFPDYLLTFGDWWRDMTPGLPLSADQSPAIGFAWLEAHRQTRGRPGDAVLFVSQGTTGEELSKMAVTLSKERPGLNIRYKLHPGEILGWRERYPWLQDARVEVIDRASNIYDEFAAAKVLVGVYSTAMFEGVAFGLPIVLASLPGYETMLPLIDAGAATLCDDGDLARAIADAAPPTDDVRARLWRPHPVKRFHEFVSKRLGT